jgi:hypothetical protein
MRTRLLAAAVLLVGAVNVAAADPPLPPVVFQAQSVGRVLDDFRAAAGLVGGEKAVKMVNKGLKEAFGEKGLEGLDINRPVVGYVVLAPKPGDITAVVALPVTGEKEFLDLCDRINRDKLKVDAKDKTLYHLPPLDPRYKAMLRFANQYAYIAYGLNPAPHIEAKALVPMPKLFDPRERATFAARVYFDRIPEDVRKAAPALFEEVKNTLFGRGGFGLGRQEMALLKPAADEIDKLLARYVKLSAGADVLTARLVLDPQAGTFVAEAVLTPKPDTDLAKIIAAWKPTQNKFGALAAHPDTVAAFKLRLPLFEEEIKNAAAIGLEAVRKEATNGPEPVKAVLDELFKGFIRTAKTGEFDITAGVRGPDKDGWFTAVGAVAFEDPAALEKEFRKFVEKQAPQDVQDGIKWDAAKAGTVNIHTWKVPAGGFFRPVEVFGGDKTTVAFAFAPHGVFLALGPEPVAVLKDALATKPVESPVVDIVLNPARVRKLIRKLAPDDAEAARVEEWFGKEDKLASILSVTLEGGKELKAKFTLDLRVIPKMFAETYLSSFPARPEPFDPDKK